MAYRAEIEISVKGQRQLEQLRSTTNLSARAADSLRDSLAKSGGLNQTLQSYSNILQTTSRTLKNVIFETEGETKAIKEYVTALGQSNEAAARQNRLIEAEVTLRNKAKKSIETRRKRDEFLAGPGKTIGAEKSAQRAAKESARRQREFKEIESYNRSIFNIEQGFNKQIRDYEIDTLLKTFKLEENLQDRAFRNALDLDKKEGSAFDAELQRRVQATEAADKAASQARRLTGQTSPIGGATNIPGSPAAKRRLDRNKRASRFQEDLMLGAGFPLLMGGGVGAVGGGVLGAVLGGGKGGFGAQIFFGALGQQLDVLAKKGIDLGKALSPLTADIGKIVESIGAANTVTGLYITELENLVGKKAALEAATAELAVVVGDDGVQSLREVGEAFTSLGNSLSEFITLLLTQVAKLTVEPLQNFAGGVENLSLLQQGTRSTDPTQQRLTAEANSTQNLEKVLGLQNQIIERQKELNALRDEDLANKIAIADGSKLELETAERNLVIAQGANDLLKDNVFAASAENLAQKLIADKLALRKEAENDVTKEKSLQNRLSARQLQFDTDLLNLTDKRADAEERKRKAAEAAAKRAEAEAKRLQRELEAQSKGISSAQVGSMQALIAGSRAGLQSTRVFEGEKAFLEESEKALEYEVRLKTRILDIQYKQRASQAKSQEEAEHLFNTYNTQYDTLERIYFTQLQQVRQQKEQLRVQEEINALQQAEETAGIERGFRRNIADVERRIASPFGGDDSDMLNLRIEQLRRTEDIYRDIDTQVSILNKKLEEDRSNKIIADNIKALEERKQKLEELLPVLDQVEQAELRQNQLMEKYGFIADEAATAMSSAVQSVITGTGSVQEAFSDMFANIGKAFIDMATQMIAKALVMKALNILGSAFGGGGGGGGGNIFTDIASRGGLRANGGQVSANTPYIVGERGPELMVPSGNGTVIPNDVFDAARGAMGGSSSESTNAFNENANSISTTNSYIRERVMERESQKTVGGAGSMVIETQVINNVEYATLEQVRVASATSAKQARAQVFSDMKNKPSRRAMVGLK